jgi:hypothetical protein
MRSYVDSDVKHDGEKYMDVVTQKQTKRGCARIQNLRAKSASSIFAVGQSSGETFNHFNGQDWYRYPLFTDSNIDAFRIWTDGKAAFVVEAERQPLSGQWTRTFVLHGKQISSRTLSRKSKGWCANTDTPITPEEEPSGVCICNPAAERRQFFTFINSSCSLDLLTFGISTFST